MNLYRLYNGMYQFGTLLGDKDTIIRDMLKLEYSYNEILFAFESLDNNIDNKACFGVINKTFIYSEDNRIISQC